MRKLANRHCSAHSRDLLGVHAEAVVQHERNEVSMLAWATTDKVESEYVVRNAEGQMRSLGTACVTAGGWWLRSAEGTAEVSDLRSGNDVTIAAVF